MKKNKDNDPCAPKEETQGLENVGTDSLPGNAPAGKPGSRRFLAAVCGLALLAAVGGGCYLGASRAGSQQGATAQSETSQTADNNATGGSASGSAAQAHTHDWTVTYKTVHHDAVTHTEHVDPVFQNQTTYHTVCNECKQVIDGKADEHIKDSGHSGYSTNVPITDEVMVSEGYDREVTDTPAYDETVIDKMVCTTCGETKDAQQAVTDASA